MFLIRKIKLSGVWKVLKKDTRFNNDQGLYYLEISGNLIFSGKALEKWPYLTKNLEMPWKIFFGCLPVMIFWRIGKSVRNSSFNLCFFSVSVHLQQLYIALPASKSWPDAEAQFYWSDPPHSTLLPVFTDACNKQLLKAQ